MNETTNNSTSGDASRRTTTYWGENSFTENEMEIIRNKERGKRKHGISDEMIFLELYKAILENRIPPGGHLSQYELARIFGVNKSRIYPILQQLADRNLVVLIKNRGAFVAKPSFEEVYAVNQARKMIEEAIIHSVIKTITPEQIERLHTIIDKVQNLKRTDNFRDKHEYAHELTGLFHIELAKCTGNFVVVDFLSNLISRDSLAVELYQRPKNAFAHSINDHPKILQYIADGKEELAVKAMIVHLDNILNSLEIDDTSDKYTLKNALSHIVTNTPQDFSAK